MIIKNYLNMVEERLDAKPSWGAKEVKSLLKDVLIEMYEKELADESIVGKDKGNNQSVQISPEYITDGRSTRAV